MIRSQLDTLIRGIRLEGWCFAIAEDGGHTRVHFDMIAPPLDRAGGVQLPRFGDSFVVGPDWDRDRVVRRLFANLQYLLDHELREQFMVDGVRPFEAHDPPITGFQKEWFVERESAVLGY